MNLQISNKWLFLFYYYISSNKIKHFPNTSPHLFSFFHHITKKHQNPYNLCHNLLFLQSKKKKCKRPNKKSNLLFHPENCLLWKGLKFHSNNHGANVIILALKFCLNKKDFLSRQLVNRKVILSVNKIGFFALLFCFKAIKPIFYAFVSICK